MACPGGCLNGGGQLKPGGGQTPAQLLDQLELLYHAGQPGEQQLAGSCGGAGGCASGDCRQRQRQAGQGCGEPGQAGMAGASCGCGVQRDGQQQAGAAEAAGAAGVLYEEWVGGAPGSAAARQLLHTQYHKREKTVTSVLSDW
jgi:hypothetical protein